MNSGINYEEMELARIQSDIAWDISMAREKRGITRQELAGLIGKKHGVVTRWENGTGEMSVKSLNKLANSLDLELNISLIPKGRQSRP